MLAAPVLRVLRCFTMAAVVAATRSKAKTRSKGTSQSKANPDKPVVALIQLLEAGTSPWRREWVSCGVEE